MSNTLTRKRRADRTPARRATKKRSGAQSERKVAVTTAAGQKGAARRTAPPRRTRATAKPKAARRDSPTGAAAQRASKTTDRAAGESRRRRRPAVDRSRSDRAVAPRSRSGPARRRPAPRPWWKPASTPKLPATEVGERIGWSITVLVIGLTLFGLVMVLSASSVSSVHRADASPFFYFSRQLRYALLGGLAFFAGSRMNYRHVARLAVPAAVFSAVLLVVVLIPGVGRTVNGSSRWLSLGPVVIQPAEFAKLSVILVTATLLARRENHAHRPERTIRPVLVIVGAFSALLLAQPKLGTPVIMGTVAILMLYVGKVHVGHLAKWAFSLLAVATVLAYSAPYRRARVLAFLDPWSSPDGIGMQTIQSQIGIASGGLLGRGLGASRAKWGFLPEAQTDFIFAVVAEELGVVGAAGLVLAFGLFGYLGFLAALRAPDAFGRLLASGLTIWIVTQTALNIGMALGLAPITGEPLPFVSLGGSSLVTTLFASGVLVGIARRGRR